MFNKVKSIFGKNSKRLKSVLAFFLLSVGCTGTSFAKPRSVNLNTYDFAEVMKTAKDNKGKVGLTLASIISILGIKKAVPVVNDYMDIRAIRRVINKIDVHKASDKEIKDALDKIRDVNKVSNKVLGIADNIIEKYLKIGKRREIIDNAYKNKQQALDKSGKNGDIGLKECTLTYQQIDKEKKQALSKLQLSADEWFTKLGGTQKDIDGYKKPDLSKISKKAEQIIAKDIPRTFTNKDGTNRTQKLELLGEILKKFEIEEFQGYTQGYNFIAAVVINKFTESDKKMSEGEQFSEEKKAKIYYVYKTIVQTVVNYSVGKNGITSKNWDQKLVRLYERMLLSFCKRNNVNEIVKSVFLSDNFVGVIIPVICSRHLELESKIFLWDSIISEVKDGNFDPNLAVEKIFDVWFARALVSHKDFCNDTDLKYLGALGLDQFMGGNPI